MKHVVLTKFAVSFSPDNPRKRFEADDNWLPKRWELFKKYCLPSMQSQTFKDFEWLILASVNFRGFDKYVDELKKYATIMWIDYPWSDGIPEIAWDLRKKYRNEEWICTTRLDSDDIVHPTFMEGIARSTLRQEEWLSYYKGYYLKDDKVWLCHVVPNPFLSYVEPVLTEIKTVYQVKDHIKAEKLSWRTGIPIRNIEGASWVHVFHGGNIKDKTSPSWPVLQEGGEDLLKDFVYVR